MDNISTLYNRLGIHTIILMPILVDDYSLCVEADLSNFGMVILYYGRNKKCKPKEILATESGSVLYFKESIRNLFKQNHIYLSYCWTKEYFNYVNSPFYTFYAHTDIRDLLCI